MDVLITILLFIVIPAFVFILIGLYLISRLVGGFGNLRTLFRLLTGKGRQSRNQSSATSSSSSKSSRTYNKTKTQSHTDSRMFGQNEGTYVEFEEVKE